MEEDSWLCFYARITILDSPFFFLKERKENVEKRGKERKEKMFK